MLRALIKILSATALALGLATSARATEIACEAAPILLQDVTIVDASGRWDDQDIFIENGRISALGSDLVLETDQRVTIVERPGPSSVRVASRKPPRSSFGRRRAARPGPDGTRS